MRAQAAARVATPESGESGSATSIPVERHTQAASESAERDAVPQRMTPPPSSPQRRQEVPPTPATNAEATASVTENRSQVLSRRASTLTDISAADEQRLEKENVPEPTKKATAKKGKKKDDESQPTRRGKNKRKSR